MNIPDFSRCKDYEDAQRLIRKLGFRRYIDDGVYSQVFINNNRDYVVRVTSSEHDCWPAYARWAMKRSRSKYVPKIYQVVDLPDGTNVGVIERLIPLTDHESPPTWGWIQSSSDVDENIKYWPGYLRRLIRDIHRIFVESGEYDAEIDIHIDNVMKRKDGTWVITDPIA